MQPISYKRHRFPPDVIRHAVWLYFRFTLSLRDVEDDSVLKVLQKV
jgi:transposase-like protein